MSQHYLNKSKSWIFEDLTLVPREFYLLLTGNQLQNSTEELWDPLKFSDYDTFESYEA